MISICIPVFNRDMRATAQRLWHEMESLNVSSELICIDDHSEERFATTNREIERWGQYIVLEENIGRARIRNLFLKYAKYDYLLFLDCDSIVEEGLLARYADAIQHEPIKGVFCGGRVYDSRSDDREHHLRYIYGVKRESHNATERSRHPYRSFMTNNFIVHREVLEAIPFDERISRYGHEDTLFGYRLQQRGTPIRHLDNPVVNGDVESNEEFMEKTTEGVKNLAEIYRWMEGERAFVEQVSLLRFYERIRHARLNGIVLGLFKVMRPVVEKRLLSGRGENMPLFAFYKLGVLLECLHGRSRC